MSIQRHHTDSRMSMIVVHNGVVYLSGQVGNETTTSVKRQTEEALKKIDGLLAEAGTDKSRILSTTIWLSDISTFDQMNEAWDAWVDSRNTPARATGESKLAKTSYLVEIMVTAAL